MKRLLLSAVLGALLVATIWGTLDWQSSPVSLPTDSALPPHAADRPPIVAASATQRQPASPDEHRESGQDLADTVPWDPTRLEIDPRWGVPTEARQFLHWQLNHTTLYTGETLPAEYQLTSKDLEKHSRVNPREIRLTTEQSMELARQLAPLRDVLAEVGREEWRLKGIGMHEAIERGDYFEHSTAADTSSREDTARLGKGTLDRLRSQLGRQFEDFIYCVISAPPTEMGSSYAVFLPRAAATDAFRHYDEAQRILALARQQATEFFRGL